MNLTWIIYKENSRPVKGSRKPESNNCIIYDKNLVDRDTPKMYNLQLVAQTVEI